MPEQNYKWISRKYLFAYFFFGVFIFLLYQFLRLLGPFVDAIIISMTLALVFFPLAKKIRSKMPKCPSLAAGISVFLVFLIVVVPVIFIIWMLYAESKDLITISEKLLSTTPKTNIFGTSINLPIPDSILKLWEKIQSMAATVNFDIREAIFKNVKTFASNISSFGGTFAKNTFLIIMDFLVLIATLFMFFREGDTITKQIIELAPMEDKHKTVIAERLYGTFVAIIRGVLFTAFLQALVAALGYTIAGLRVPIVLGLATGMAALIPVIGSAIIWVPIGIYLIAIDSLGWGVFIFLWGGLLVSSMDNIIRPIVIGREAKLPVIILFLSILGGLRTFGLRGVVIGPVVVASVVTFLQIYKTEFQKRIIKNYHEEVHQPCGPSPRQ
jgi:predicted PurR-regulated permease PerM